MRLRRHLEYIKFRNVAEKIKRCSQRVYKTKLARNAKRNPKAFYRYAQSRRATREESPRVASSNKHKVDLLAHFFKSVHHKDNNTSLLGSYLFPSNSTTMPSISFTTQEVHIHMDVPNQNISAGPDGLHPANLKPLEIVLLLPLATLIERSLMGIWLLEDCSCCIDS